MITKFSQAIRAYIELLKTGGIQCKAEGEYVLLDLRGNLTGDILLFIGPRNNTVTAISDIYGLIQADSKLIMQRKAVFKSLSQKFKGLTLLPESIVWSINTGISAFYFYYASDSILANFGGSFDFRRILSILPLFILAIITPFLARTFGIKLLKPSLSLIVWIVKHSRKIRNRKIS